jgi:hypothetical protein
MMTVEQDAEMARIRASLAVEKLRKLPANRRLLHDALMDTERDLRKAIDEIENARRDL